MMVETKTIISYKSKNKIRNILKIYVVLGGCKKTKKLIARMGLEGRMIIEKV